MARTQGKTDVKGEAILTVLMFVAVFAIAFLLHNLLHLDVVYTSVFTALIAGIILVFLFRKAQGDRWQRENEDAEKTVVPLIEGYAQGHDARALMRGYEKWCEDAHDIDLQLQFLQLIVEAFADDGKRIEARAMLDEMEHVAHKSGNDKNFAAYRADVEGRLASK